MSDRHASHHQEFHQYWCLFWLPYGNRIVIGIAADLDIYVSYEYEYYSYSYSTGGTYYDIFKRALAEAPRPQQAPQGTQGSRGHKAERPRPKLRLSYADFSPGPAVPVRWRSVQRQVRRARCHCDHRRPGENIATGRPRWLCRWYLRASSSTFSISVLLSCLGPKPPWSGTFQQELLHR